MVQAKAEAKGRKLNYGIRLHVIVRETNDRHGAAEELIQYVDDATIAAAQAKFKSNGLGRSAPYGRTAQWRSQQTRSVSKPLGRCEVWYVVVQVQHWLVIQKLWAARIQEYADLRYQIPSFSQATHIWKNPSVLRNW